MVSVIFDYCLSKLQVNEVLSFVWLVMYLSIIQHLLVHVTFWCAFTNISNASTIFFLTETAGHKLSPLDKFISGCLLDCFSCNNLPMCDLLTLSLTNFCCSVSKCCHGHRIYGVVMCIKAFFVAIPGWLSGQSICFSMSSTRAMHYHKLKFL